MLPDRQEETLLLQEHCKLNRYLLERPHMHEQPPNSSHNGYHCRLHPMIAAINLYFQETGLFDSDVVDFLSAHSGLMIRSLCSIVGVDCFVLFILSVYMNCLLLLTRREIMKNFGIQIIKKTHAFIS